MQDTSDKCFTVTAWSNGGSGYGLKLSKRDRDSYFSDEQKEVKISLPNGTTCVANINKPSFWKGCRELIHKDIGTWLKVSGHSSWPKGHPPKFHMIKVSETEYAVKSLAD